MFLPNVTKKSNMGSLYGLLSTVITEKLPEVDLAMLSDDKYVTTGIG